jgi:type II secretory pathway component PulK
VNVNTAPPEVLASLLEEENESLVREITAYTRKRYFKDMNEFEKEIGEAIPASLKANACVGSDSFQIIAEGRVNEARKQVQAFVYRDDEANVKVLYWRVVP